MDNNQVPDSILDKIRKLQALADNAGTEFEAANAAERVAQLCRKHNLDIGVARLEREETEATEALHGMGGAVWSAHWSSLAAACKIVFGVGIYRKPTYEPIKDMFGTVVGTDKQETTVFYGLKANVSAATITYGYLLASVEAMLAGWVRTTGGGPADRRSFRIGCAKRIYDEASKLRAAKAQVAGTTEGQALVRLENALIARHAAKCNLQKKGGRSAGVKNREAYGAGYAAGGRVDIHGARSSRMLA